MPTIDELAPATASTNTDELPANQNGFTRKVTRAQILAGVQPQLVIPAGTIVGRISAGSGAPETITVGSFLNFASGTLSAMAAPYSVALPPAGFVPGPADLVPLGQSGNNVAVSYSVFLQGLSSVATVNGSQLLVTPTGATASMTLAKLVSSMITATGGSLSGPLSLAGAPISPLQAATKGYVDANPASNGVINIKLPPCNAVLNGVTDDTAAFTTAYQLASSGGTIYVPNGTTVMQASPNWTIPTTKRVKWIVDGTTLANGTQLGDAIPGGAISGGPVLPATVTGYGSTGTTVSQANSQSTDFAVLHASYVVNHVGGSVQTVISNSRTDTIINQSPFNNVWSGYDRLVWAGTQTPSATSPSRHVSRYIQAVRQTVGTSSSGSPLPQPLMWASYVQYLDTTGEPSSWTNASVSSEIDWIGNGADDASQRQILSLVLGQYNLSGASVGVSTAVGVSLASGSTGTIGRVFNVAVPFSVSVLDTSNATQLSGAVAVRLASGQTIAFEPTNTNNLTYSASSNAIIAKYGASTCAIGRGISVCFGTVFASSATLSSTSVGSIVFLVGSGAYTITLPAAATLMPGTGFTFSAIGTGTVSIVSQAGDTIDLTPITLREYDRYHIISDGSSLWRETFRTNSVSPRFAGPPVLPSYTVATLPTGLSAGSVAFASNGRKPSQGSGAGTGVEVFFDGSNWISVCSGTAVAA
jgi:hypothetical protein